MKFEHTSVMNFKNALRGMRNPMNSWAQSDSYEQTHLRDDGLVDVEYVIGENDMKLAQKLIKAGSDHRKFLRQILVSVDIIAPLYWWKEFDTYKVGTVANSCSTMHKIYEKEFTTRDFSFEHLVSAPVKNAKAPAELLEDVIYALNNYREAFIETKDKKYWWQMIQLLPSSYNQTRTITMNYENICNMYHARGGHKLSEWSQSFCSWVKTLPYAKELIIGE